MILVKRKVARPPCPRPRAGFVHELLSLSPAGQALASRSTAEGLRSHRAESRRPASSSNPQPRGRRDRARPKPGQGCCSMGRTRSWRPERRALGGSSGGSSPRCSSTCWSSPPWFRLRSAILPTRLPSVRVCRGGEVRAIPAARSVPPAFTASDSVSEPGHRRSARARARP